MNAELAGITGPGTAFLAGLVTSLHCAGMCGPLACALLPGPGDRADASTVATVYHASRLAGYAMLGTLAGALGAWPLRWLGSEGTRWLPWILVAFFIAVAVRFDRRLPRIPALGQVYFHVSQRLRGGSRVRAAAALGAATPLLPCGPLYFVVTLAALGGSALRGTELMLAFGLGTVPLLWVAQMNFGWLRARLGPAALARAQTVVALAVALVLAWRLRGTLGLGGPDPSSFGCF